MAKRRQGGAARGERAAKYHEEFAEKMIKAMEAGTAPWQKPWVPGTKNLPHNFQTDHVYRGGNSWHLQMAADEAGYQDPRWGGYRQITNAGGHVRAGEKGTKILYASTKVSRARENEDGTPVIDVTTGEAERVQVARRSPVVKVQTVFNVEQTEGLTLPSRAAVPVWEGQQRAESVLQNSGVEIQHVAGDRAVYSLSQDRVTLPERGQFPTSTAYYRTALHELGHATGHPSRLNRETLTGSAKESYSLESRAREELRAEMASVMTGDRLGLGSEPRHGAAYVKNWVAALKDDPVEIHRAASDAQAMSDWLVAREREQERGVPSGTRATTSAAVASPRPEKVAERGEQRREPVEIRRDEGMRTR